MTNLAPARNAQPTPAPIFRPSSNIWMPFWYRGRVIGERNADTLLKPLRHDHIYYSMPGIGNGAALLNELESMGIWRIWCRYMRTGAVYAATIAQIRTHAEFIHHPPYEPQFVLHLDRWHVQGPRIQLEELGPPAMAQASLFAGVPA